MCLPIWNISSPCWRKLLDPTVILIQKGRNSCEANGKCHRRRMDLGASKRGASLGPAAIRLAGLRQGLESLGYRVKDLGDVQPLTLEETEGNLRCAQQVTQVDPGGVRPGAGEPGGGRPARSAGGRPQHRRGQHRRRVPVLRPPGKIHRRDLDRRPRGLEQPGQHPLGQHARHALFPRCAALAPTAW